MVFILVQSNCLRPAAANAIVVLIALSVLLARLAPNSCGRVESRVRRYATLIASNL